MTHHSNGILAPDGSFHPCEYYGHTSLFERLAQENGTPDLREDDMIRRGYIPLRTGQFWFEYVNVTQRQFDFICEYQAAHPEECIVYVDSISPIRTISELEVR